MHHGKEAVMKKIREWGFPVALVIVWVVVSGYTVSNLMRLPTAAPAVHEPA
jgi:hypothetical protein